MRADRQTNRQTDRHTNTLIAILHSLTGDKVNGLNLMKMFVN